MAGRVDHRGFGHVRKLPSGRYQASYVGPDLVRHTAPSTFDTREDAGAWLWAERKLTTDDERGWVPPKARRATVSRDSFAAFATNWIDTRRTKKGPIKARTKEHYQALLDRVLIPTFGSTPVRDLNPEGVRAWFDRLDPATPTLNAHAYALLSAICRTAVEQRLLSTNPCQIRGGATARTVRRIEPATLDELAVIVTEVPPRYRLMVLLAAWCALRFGELTELRRRDVDLKRGLIRVHRAVVWVEGAPVVGTPKSDAGHRDVAIPPHIEPVIKAHLATLPAGRDVLLFSAASNPAGHMRPATLTKVFYRARRIAGRPDLPFHGLRHTGATLAAQTGATLGELMHRLGHSTVGAAMRYQHAARGRDAEIAALLSQMAERPR